MCTPGSIILSSDSVRMCAHNAHSSIDTLTADNITASALSTTHSHFHKKHNIPLPAIICLVYQSVEHELLPERLLQRSNVACSVLHHRLNR